MLAYGKVFAVMAVLLLPAVPKPQEHKPALTKAAEVHQSPKAQAPKVAISQYFGGNEKAYRKFGVKGHTGLDLAADCGTPAGSPATATVLKTGDDKDYGHFVKMVDYGGNVILLGHFDKILVKAGDNLEVAQQVATVGSTGNSTGCHIHFELHPKHEDKHNGYQGAIDPINYLPPDCALHGVPAVYAEYVCAATRKYPHATPSTVMAVMTYENRFNLKGYPDPLTYPWPCSYAGACGPMQFMPDTWWNEKKHRGYREDGPALYPGDGGGDGIMDSMKLSDAIFGAAHMISDRAEKCHENVRCIAIEYNAGGEYFNRPDAQIPSQARDYYPHIQSLRDQFNKKEPS